MAYSSNVGVGQVGSFWVGADEDVASNIISPTGFSQRAFGVVSFGGFLDATNAGFTQRAFGTPSIILGSLNPTGFSRRAFGTFTFGIQAIGFSRQAFGTPSVAGHGFVLDALGINQRAFGTPTLVNLADPINVYIAGVDRTAWVTDGTLKRSWQLGSICTASFQLDSSNAGGYRPNEIDTVVIQIGTYRFFSGWVDNYEEFYYPGAFEYKITVNCQGFQAALDKTFVGIDVNFSFAGLGFLLQYVCSAMASFGITWGGLPAIPAYITVPPQTFNYPPASQIVQDICKQFGLAYIVDQYRTLRAFFPDTGTGPAPFSITDGNTTEWQQITITRGGLYRNVQGVRNTQQQLADDSAPAVPGWASTGSTRLSQLAVEEDGTEIAAVGGKRFQAMEDVRDQQSYPVMQDTARVLLAEGVKHLIKASIECTRIGLEPGQLLTINTTTPPMVENLLIEQVDSQAVGGMVGSEIFFRHVVKASNSTFRRAAGIQWMQNLVNRTNNPPIDRITYSIVFTYAETIEGITNPGLTTGVKAAIVQAPKTGVGRGIIMTVNTPATTTPCVFDVLQNGVSIFAPGHLPTLDVGATNLGGGVWQFATNPLLVTQGDNFTTEVIAADPTAMDIALQFTVYG